MDVHERMNSHEPSQPVNKYVIAYGKLFFKKFSNLWNAVIWNQAGAVSKTFPILPRKEK